MVAHARRFRLVAALVVGAWSGVLLDAPQHAYAAPASAANTGVTWRITTSMSMQGMSIPGQSTEVCQPLNAPTTVPAANQDSNCSVTNHRRTGNTETFDMRCTGEEPMQGRMEITHLGPDHYRGRMRATTAEGTVEFAYEGRKLGRSCDAGAIERQINAAAAQGTAQLAEMCRTMAAEGEPSQFIGSKPLCTAAADRAALCSAIKGYQGFGKLLENRRFAIAQAAAGVVDNSDAVAGLCRIRIDSHLQQLCGGAEAAGQLAFLGAQCPSLAEPIARRECVGRSFSTPVAARYVDFCNAWIAVNQPQGQGSTTADATGEDARAPREEPRNPIREGAREALKGILGF